MVQHLAAELPQQSHHQGCAARAVDVVIAEHADRLAVLHRIGEPIGRDVHVDQHGRVGQQRAQRRLEEVARRVDVDAARREQAADDFRHAHALGDAETDAVLALRHTQRRPLRLRSTPRTRSLARITARASVLRPGLRAKLWCASM